MERGASVGLRVRRPAAVGAATLAGITAVLAWPLLLGDALGAQGYMPHGHCYLWQTPLVALHLVSDSLIGLAYLSISLTLAYLIYRARSELPFRWIFLAFGTFILACGTTHFMEVWTLWNPSYWLSGDVKALTALASVTTAAVLPPLVPRVLELLKARRVAEDRRVQLEAAEERAALLAREQAARAEAEAARAAAETANQAKDAFLATISHELRNPLSPILAWSRLLRAGALDPERATRAIEAIERAATSQAQLVDDLLDVSRIVSGKIRMSVRPTQLGALIEAAIESLRLSAEAKQIRLEVALDRSPAPIAGDPDRLQQVVWNLVSNAIKFTPKGGRVQVRLACVASQVDLTVSDDGLGIDPPLLPRLFERFWQADGETTRRQSGLGLGLAIVRHIVELHGGTVSAQSRGLGQGATFRVSLPLLPAEGREGTDGPAREERAPRATVSPDLRGLRVLVVDDEPDSNEAVHAVLSRCAAEVRVAGSAAQALEILARWRPDVLVSDIGMPGDDGYSLISRVRALGLERGGGVPALALTAYAHAEDRLRALDAGFEMHVAKPFEPSELVAAVARLGGRSLAPTPPHAPEGTQLRETPPG